MDRLSNTFILILVLFSTIFIQSCGGDDDRFTINFDNAPDAYDTSSAIRDTTLNGGVKVYIYEEGTGPFKVVSKDQIEVKITARDENGRIVDSSFNSRNASGTRLLLNLTPTPVSNRRGINLLVEGLRKALLGMKEGGIRTIVIPPEMAFSNDFISKTGRTGPLLTSSLDLRDLTITYDVELLNIF